MRETLTRNIDQAYDQYLSSNEKEAVQAIQHFEERLEKSLIKYGRFNIPTFFKAHFLTPRQERLIKASSEAIFGLLNKVIDLYFKEPGFKSHFHFSDEQRALFEI